MNKAIFLDKDGTIIRNIPYNICIEKIIIEPKTVQGLIALQKKGYVLIIVTNQSGVGKGYFSEQAFIDHIHNVIDLFSQKGVKIDGYYYCPHDYEKTSQGFLKSCLCGKPKPGMLLQGAKDFSIDLSKSWMIGDILNDIEAGNAAHAKTILVDNGNETEWVLNGKRKPTYTVKSFYEAAQVVLETYA